MYCLHPLLNSNQQNIQPKSTHNQIQYYKLNGDVQKYDKNAQRAILKTQLLKEILYYGLQQLQLSPTEQVLLKKALRRVSLQSKQEEWMRLGQNNGNQFLVDFKFETRIAEGEVKQNQLLMNLNQLMKWIIPQYIEYKLQLINTSNEFLMDDQLTMKELSNVSLEQQKLSKIFRGDIIYCLNIINTRQQELSNVCNEAIQMITQYIKQVQFKQCDLAQLNTTNQQLMLQIFKQQYIKWVNQMIQRNKVHIDTINKQNLLKQQQIKELQLELKELQQLEEQLVINIHLADVLKENKQLRNDIASLNQLIQ